MRDHLVAVDIGTASARAGIFDRSGRLIAKEAHPILLYRPDALIAEQDSDDIWNAVCRSVRSALAASGIGSERIAAIGFDATCSLVIRNPAVPSSPRQSGLDIICWMDHRAREEAQNLSTHGGPVVARSGGLLCPEMALPKLLWLKRHRPDLWSSTEGIFDLADYMTFRATGSRARSLSTLVSKWGYGATDGWPFEFLDRTGLGDLPERAGIDGTVLPVGASSGVLSPEAAAALGLDTGCQVSAGMVDAYAGALGLLGAMAEKERDSSVALVAGTSSCLITLHRSEPAPHPSLWGPFADVSLPGFYLREGGQSAAGSLLDHMVQMHPAGGEPRKDLHERIMTRIEAALAEHGPGYGLPLCVLPDFHGNRAPGADPFATGTISGLTLDTSFESLCRLYWRTVISLACGLRHILDAFAATGSIPDRVMMAGGHVQNPLVVQAYADMVGLPVHVPRMKEAILLGTAINSAAAARIYPTVAAAAKAMTGPSDITMPRPATRLHYDADYSRYLLQLRHRTELSSLLPDPVG